MMRSALPLLLLSALVLVIAAQSDNNYGDVGGGRERRQFLLDSFYGDVTRPGGSQFYFSQPALSSPFVFADGASAVISALDHHKSSKPSSSSSSSSSSSESKEDETTTTAAIETATSADNETTTSESQQHKKHHSHHHGHHNEKDAKNTHAVLAYSPWGGLQTVEVKTKKTQVEIPTLETIREYKTIKVPIYRTRVKNVKVDAVQHFPEHLQLNAFAAAAAAPNSFYNFGETAFAAPIRR